MAHVMLQGVKKEYKGGVLALKGINLEVKEGEFLVLLGPSGCGKTTILRMIAGIDKPTEGDVLFDGESVVSKKAQERNIAMVFQSFVLYPHMNVYKNIAYPLKNQKLPKDVIDLKVRQAAQMFGITDLLNRRPRVLSGGQKQRVAIARAMVRDPQVFLLDEPFSNLDAELRDELREQVRMIHQKTQATMVYVTHDQMEAMALADRIAVMQNGVIHQVGTPREIYDHPANLFTAGFVGTPRMNVIPAVVKEHRVWLGEKDTGMICHVKDQEITLGIRPEAFLCDEKYAEDVSYIAFHAIAEGEERSGMGRALRIRLDGMTQNMDPCIVSDRKIMKCQENDNMVLYVKRDRIHLFDESGVNLGGSE